VIERDQARRLPHGPLVEILPVREVAEREVASAIWVQEVGRGSPEGSRSTALLPDWSGVRYTLLETAVNAFFALP
jgi:hypothetical protein